MDGVATSLQFFADMKLSDTLHFTQGGSTAGTQPQT